MPKRTQTKGAAKAGGVIMLLLGAGVVAGVAAYVKLGPPAKVPANEHRPEEDTQIQRPSKRQKQGDETVREQSPETVTIPSPKWSKDELTFTNRDAQVPSGEDPKVYAVNEFLKDSKVLDSSTRLLSVDAKHGFASLYFNEGLNQTMGSFDEKLVLESLQRLMGQFKDVDKFEIYANAKKLDTLGNVDLSEPIPVIRLGVASESKLPANSPPTESR